MNQTITCLVISFIIASILTLQPINYWGDFNWRFAESFPIAMLGQGMHQMDIFFHEIGHTIFHWFYGKPSIPTFDFQHGGGVAYGWPQEIFILIIIHALFLYGLFHFRENRTIQILIGIVGIFHAATAYNDMHKVVYLFMGHGTTIAIGGFLLYRALFDLAPRGILERYLNGIIGFGIIFQNMVLFVGLMHDEIVQTVYFHQKGGHGRGDFNKISTLIDIANVPNVALTSLIYSIIILIIPFVLYFITNQHFIDQYGDNIDETLQKNK